MRIPFVLLASVVALTASVALAAPASADCSGPAISYDRGTIDRGGSVTVNGTGWGDGCYDTGPPPDGEGVLGNPLTDVEISFVQGGARIVVATGAADSDYEFEIDVAVPVALEPGPVQLVAESGQRAAFVDPTAEPLVVSSKSPVASESSVVTFRPDPEAGDDGTDPRWLALPAIAVIALGALVLRRRQSAGA